MDEIKRSLAALYEAKDLLGEALHALVGLAANAPNLSWEQRRVISEDIHRLIDEIEETD